MDAGPSEHLLEQHLDVDYGGVLLRATLRPPEYGSNVRTSVRLAKGGKVADTVNSPAGAERPQPLQP